VFVGTDFGEAVSGVGMVNKLAAQENALLAGPVKDDARYLV
jgi:hypothetical protein